MNALDIKNMTTEEKLQAIEALRDSLIHDYNEVKSPDWHGEVLRETEKRYKSGKEDAILKKISMTFLQNRIFQRRTE